MSKQSVIIDENGEEKLEVITEEDERAEEKEEKLNNTEEVTDTFEATTAVETAVTNEEIEDRKNEKGDETQETDAVVNGDEKHETDAVEIEVPTELATKKKPSRAIVEDDDDEELMFRFSSPDISYEEYDEENTVEEEMEIPLEEKLDRNKLIDAYKKMILEKSQVDRFNELLNNQVYEYFNSKSIFRASLEDDPSQLFEIMQKYQSCLYELDRLIPKKNKIADNCRNLINSLNNEETYVRSEFEKNLNELNTRLRETGITFQSAKSGQFLSEKVITEIIKLFLIK